MTSAMTKGAPDDTRFEFGANWQRFLSVLDEQRIDAAEESLSSMLGRQRLDGLSFLDIGSGSGLFSLAARRLGARVHSFDYDARSVACTAELKRRYFPGDPDWTVEQGSVLDGDYVRSLGAFDIIYSWGVLHHTGNMWAAIENATLPVRPAGQLFIAIYNDQGSVSSYWSAVKRIYNAHPVGRAAMIGLHAPYLIGVRLFVRLIARRGQLQRGMAYWYDMLDWLGGWPFEVAPPAAIERFLNERGFTLERDALVGRRQGCNEYLFKLAGRQT